MVGKISVCYENIVRFLYICRRAQIKITSTPTHHFLVTTDGKFYYRSIKIIHQGRQDAMNNGENF